MSCYCDDTEAETRVVTLVLRPFGAVASVRYRFSLPANRGRDAENWIFKKVGKGVSSRFQHSLEYHPGEEYTFHGIMWEVERWDEA